jgi:hypothetical protein
VRLRLVGLTAVTGQIRIGDTHREPLICNMAAQR